MKGHPNIAISKQSLEDAEFDTKNTEEAKLENDVFAGDMQDHAIPQLLPEDLIEYNVKHAAEDNTGGSSEPDGSQAKSPEADNSAMEEHLCIAEEAG